MALICFSNREAVSSDNSVVAVTDLALSDFEVSGGGSVSSLSNTAPGQYTISVTPGSLRGLTTVTLKMERLMTHNFVEVLKFEHVIDFVEPVTRYADLEGWWKLRVILMIPVEMTVQAPFGNKCSGKFIFHR